ncbi:Programmed cell death protein 10 [Camponotus japonicus]
MTMGDEIPVTSLVLPVILRPILTKLERQNVMAAQTLRAALSKAESSHPGITHDLIMGIIRRADLNLDMNESVLRLQGAASDYDVVEYRSARSEDAFQELNRKSTSLKRILSRIPDEITDRKTFLETIKEIASAIKKLLDAVNEVTGFIPGSAGKQALDQRKREFVKYSKRFSNTLKEYFKEGQANAVFVSALYLIHQTNMIMLTVKDKSSFEEAGWTLKSIKYK